MSKMHAVPSNPTLEIESNFTIAEAKAEAKAAAILDLLACVDRNNVTDELLGYTVSNASEAALECVKEMQAAFTAIMDLKGRAAS